MTSESAATAVERTIKLFPELSCKKVFHTGRPFLLERDIVHVLNLSGSSQPSASVLVQFTALFALESSSNLILRLQSPLIHVPNPSFGNIHICSAK